MTDFEAPIQGPLRNPELPEEVDKELDKLGEIMPAGQAWSIVAKKHGINEDDLTEAARRTVEPEAIYSETTTPSMNSVEARAAAGARKDREISIAAKKAALGDRNKNFVEGMLADINTFDVKAYIAKHPDKRAEAIELGFLKEVE